MQHGLTPCRAICLLMMLQVGFPVPYCCADDQDTTDLQKAIAYVVAHAARHELAVERLTVVALGEQAAWWWQVVVQGGARCWVAGFASCWVAGDVLALLCVTAAASHRTWATQRWACTIC